MTAQYSAVHDVRKCDKLKQIALDVLFVALTLFEYINLSVDN